MRPQDVVILLKVLLQGDTHWYMKDLSHELRISSGECSHSLVRSSQAGLLMEDKRTVVKQALLEFLIHGLKYVYPAQLGPNVRGLRTGAEGAGLSGKLIKGAAYVWPWSEGDTRGIGVIPLFSSVPEACSIDPRLHQLLSLVDVIRIGRAREVRLAITKLTKLLK